MAASRWSANPNDQKLLQETPLAHVVPDHFAPCAAVIVNNLGGNNLAYYIKRGMEYAADGCNGPTRNHTVTVKLSSTAPPACLTSSQDSNGSLQAPNQGSEWNYADVGSAPSLRRVRN
jgi:hypothetical protein